MEGGIVGNHQGIPRRVGKVALSDIRAPVRSIGSMRPMALDFALSIVLFIIFIFLGCAHSTSTSTAARLALRTMTEDYISPFTDVHRPLSDHPLLKWKAHSQEHRLTLERRLIELRLDTQLGEDSFALLSSWIHDKLSDNQPLWRLTTQAAINGWLHYIDAYFVFHAIFLSLLLSGEMIPEPAYTPLQEEQKQLIQLVDDGMRKAASHPRDVHKWCIFKALKLSFRKIKYTTRGREREGYIITWSALPSSMSFPIECVFQDAANKKTGTVWLREDDMCGMDISQSIPTLLYKG